ncbi:MBL fold metallo-hydrolase, partial [Bacteroidota bacterium]
MKRKITFLTILIFFVCFSFAQRGETRNIKFEKISDNLYEILDGSGARGGAYIGDSEVLIIDSKMDKKSVDQTIEELRKITDYPIKYLVNTHSDGDHINGNQFFPEEIIFVSHENCRNDLLIPQRNGSPSKWENEELKSFVPSITFKDKLELSLGSKKVELWYFGVGHTTGDAVIYFPEEKT